MPKTYLRGILRAAAVSAAVVALGACYYAPPPGPYGYAPAAPYGYYYGPPVVGSVDLGFGGGYWGGHGGGGGGWRR
jgi:hypothetical protein